MASLLERIDVAPIDGISGPVRNRGGRAGSAPYQGRPHRLGQSKADEDTVWKHDLYKGPGKSLGSRLMDASSSNAPRVDTTGAAHALRQAVGLASARAAADLSIKGAAVGSNVIQIENLAKGTTAADVEAIFKRCGTILESRVQGNPGADRVVIRLKFKNGEDAKRAVKEFDGKSADGNVLSVSVIGSASTSLGGRLVGGTLNGSVDVLMDEDSDIPSGGSKMRSDELLADPRAVVLTAPPGAEDSWMRGGGRGRRGRGRGGRGGRRGRGHSGMDTD